MKRKKKTSFWLMGKSSHREDEKCRWSEGADAGQWLHKGLGLDVACFQGKYSTNCSAVRGRIFFFFNEGNE